MASFMWVTTFTLEVTDAGIKEDLSVKIPNWRGLIGARFRNVGDEDVYIGAGVEGDTLILGQAVSMGPGGVETFRINTINIFLHAKCQTGKSTILEVSLGDGE